MKRRLAVSIVAASVVVASVVAGLVTSAPPVGATTPPSVPDSGAPNTTVPAGCPIPMPVRATFVGSVVATDPATARFRVEQVRGGSVEGFAVGGLIDVAYGPDVRFLEDGRSYIVAVGFDESDGRLVSKVRDPEPLFGGNMVIGIGEQNLDCPEIEDAVRTLTLEGRSVESGVLAPLGDDTRGVVRALLLPAAWVLGTLFALALLATAVRSLVSTGRRVSRRPAPPRPGRASR